MELFRARFGAEPDGVWLAPGRANLMGEHTDYNDGFVLPFALGQHIVMAAARRGDGRLAISSAQEKDADVEVEVADLAPGSVTGWGAYPAGVAWALREAGYPVPGASIAIDSDVPAGAGLSSSAALECATALALTELALTDQALTDLALTDLALTDLGSQPGPAPDGSISRQDLAAIARRAENEFVGVPSGIMDQSASLLCQAGHLLLLDCRSLDTAQVPFDPAPAGARLLIVNTRARHELSDGDYGARRSECEEAARQLGVASLRDVTGPADTERLGDPLLRRRARHVVSDNQRVLAVVELLRSGAGDPETYREIGRLLTQAHESLRDDFEVSWPEADETVVAAVAAGAFGARMIGGGFGGSVLVLAGPGRDVTAAVSEAFAQRGWKAPEFLEATPSDSARRVG